MRWLIYLQRGQNHWNSTFCFCWNYFNSNLVKGGWILNLKAGMPGHYASSTSYKIPLNLDWACLKLHNHIVSLYRCWLTTSAMPVNMKKKSQFSPLQSGKKSMTKTKTATVNQNSKLVFAHINCFLWLKNNRKVITHNIPT